jgi:hypothetical protein
LHILLFACFGCVVINQQKGKDCKKNGPLAHLLWILVIDDQQDQVRLICLQIYVLQFNRMHMHGPGSELPHDFG